VLGVLRTLADAGLASTAPARGAAFTEQFGEFHARLQNSLDERGIAAPSRQASLLQASQDSALQATLKPEELKDHVQELASQDDSGALQENEERQQVERRPSEGQAWQRAGASARGRNAVYDASLGVPDGDLAAVIAAAVEPSDLPHRSNTKALFLQAAEANAIAIADSSEAGVGQAVCVLSCISGQPYSRSVAVLEPCELLVLSRRSQSTWSAGASGVLGSESCQAPSAPFAPRRATSSSASSTAFASLSTAAAPCSPHRATRGAPAPTAACR